MFFFFFPDVGSSGDSIVEMVDTDEENFAISRCYFVSCYLWLCNLSYMVLFETTLHGLYDNC